MEFSAKNSVETIFSPQEERFFVSNFWSAIIWVTRQEKNDSFKSFSVSLEKSARMKFKTERHPSFWLNSPLKNTAN